MCEASQLGDGPRAWARRILAVDDCQQSCFGKLRVRMDLRQLRYFTLVADLKSLAQASAHLGIAAPALSRSIGALEKEVKCPLFERDGRGMRLTAAGETLHGKAVQILRDVELARQDVMAEGEHLTGDVGIGATPSVIGLLGADFIKRSLDRFPKVRPRLAEGYRTP